MTFLTDLPIEILHQILGYFCLHCRKEINRPYSPQNQLREHDAPRQYMDEPPWYAVTRRPLYAACFVSRRIGKAAQSILYHEFILDWGNAQRSIYFDWSRRLTSFMCTVARRPDLAELVQCASFYPLLWSKTTHAHARYALQEVERVRDIELQYLWQDRSCAFRNDKTLRHFIRFYLDRGHSSRRDRIISNISRSPGSHSGNAAYFIFDELLSTLVAMLPNIKFIRLDRVPIFSVQPEDGQFSPSLHALGRTSISSLRTLEVSTDVDIWSFVGLTDGLESLTLNMHRNVPESVPEMPRLKTLCLIETNISKEELSRLLASCTARLETFVYQNNSATTSIPNPRGHRFELSEAITALVPFRRTLQRLHLHTRYQEHLEVSTPPIPSLKEFEVLTSLFVSASSIFNSRLKGTGENSLVDILPSSIQSLFLPGKVGSGIPQLQNGLLGLAEQLRHQRGEFPMLRVIRCGKERGLIDSSVWSIMKRVGVDVGFEHYAPIIFT